MEALSEYKFDQILAEAVHKLGADRMTECIEPHTRIYGWPIPPDKRHAVAAAVAVARPLVQNLKAARVGHYRRAIVTEIKRSIEALSRRSDVNRRRR